jgi:hypothetical protein
LLHFRLGNRRITRHEVAPLLLALCVPAGCAEQKPFKWGDILVSAKDGTELGTVTELGDHSFENGASGPSVHLQLPSGKNQWHSLDATEGTHVAKKERFPLDPP